MTALTRTWTLDVATAARPARPSRPDPALLGVAATLVMAGALWATLLVSYLSGGRL